MRLQYILSDASRLKELVEKERPKPTQVNYTDMLKSVSKAIWPAFTLLLSATFKYNAGNKKIYSQKNFNITVNPLGIQPNNYIERTNSFELDSNTHNLIAANQTDIQIISE